MGTHKKEWIIFGSSEFVNGIFIFIFTAAKRGGTNFIASVSVSVCLFVCRCSNV